MRKNVAIPRKNKKYFPERQEAFFQNPIVGWDKWASTFPKNPIDLGEPFQ